jgi:hypothetical protein
VQVKEIIVCEDVLSNRNFENAFEFVHRHSKQIDSFNQLLDDLRLENHDAVDVAEHFEDHFKDDILHAREIESLDRKLDTILNRNFQVDFLLAVVLNA